MSVDAVRQTILQRRTIKPMQYSDRSIDKEIIDDILETARWAPTHKLSEPWRFALFAGAGKQSLGEYMSGWYRDNTPADKFQQQKFDRLLAVPQQAGCAIGIGMHRDEGERLPEDEEVIAVACAVQNMQLMATAHGLGTFWSSGAIAFARETADFFGFDQRTRGLGVLFMGYPNCDWPTSERQPLDDKITWHTS
ncbi:MAG: nitroreductase [Immundisolibacteraceae bacterium]|nr:nitroreductase [Immundisolibacteraceae bacterium]